jgi:putative endonuclease
MEAQVYILQGSSGRYYVGSTTDVARRMSQHARGQTHTTKRIGDTFELVFTQKFDSIDQARKVERKIKSWKRKDFIQKIIKDGKITSVD